MKSLSIIFSVMLLFPLLSGCGFKDIDKRIFALSIGIDKGEEAEFRVTLKLFLPSGDPKNGKGGEYLLITKEANSISQAISKMRPQYGREIEFSHTKAIVFGEEVAEENMQKAVDWVTRREDIQQIAFLMIAKPTAETVLSITPKSEVFPMNTLFLMFEGLGSESPTITSKHLSQYQKETSNHGIDPTLPVLQLTENQEREVSASWVIKENKVQSKLNEEETEIVNVINTNRTEFNVTTKVDGDEYVLFIRDLKAKKQVTIRENKPPIIKIKISAEGTMEEAAIEDGTNLQKYEKEFEKEMETKTLKLLEKLQKENVDPFGFGMIYRSQVWNNQNSWKEWETFYAQTEFEVTVNVTARSSGVIN